MNIFPVNQFCLWLIRSIFIALTNWPYYFFRCLVPNSFHLKVLIYRGDNNLSGGQSGSLILNSARTSMDVNNTTSLMVPCKAAPFSVALQMFRLSLLYVCWGRTAYTEWPRAVREQLVNSWCDSPSRNLSIDKCWPQSNKSTQTVQLTFIRVFSKTG